MDNKMREKHKLDKKDKMSRINLLMKFLIDLKS